MKASLRVWTLERRVRRRYSEEIGSLLRRSLRTARIFYLVSLRETEC